MTTGLTPKGYITPNGDDPVLNGDNVITTLAGQIDTNLGRMAAGNVTAAAAGPQVMGVTFPVGRFNAIPRISVTANVSASASNPALVGFTGTTTAGVNITADRAAGGAYQVNWIAVQV